MLHEHRSLYTGIIYISVESSVAVDATSLYDAPIFVNNVLCFGDERGLASCLLDYGSFDCPTIGLAVCGGKR